MKRISHACLITLLLAFPALAAGQAETPSLEQRVDAYLKPLIDEDLISGSILIARDGKIELAKGYGPANREHGVPCTADTVYRLASVTKTFTAMAIMILQERELLSVEDTLDRYIPDYPQGDRITLHHLLTHTSGVINYSALPDHYRVWTMPHTIEEVIARFKNEPLRFEPGAKFEYSNSGYVLLTYVIEKVSGESYESFMKEAIFEPLGMQHTGMDSHTKIIPNRATGHYNFGDGIVQAPYLNAAYTSGAGGLYSTVGDLFKWDRALYTDRLVSEHTLKKMFTPRLQNYGYGWFIREEFGRRLIEHRGGINGFLTMIQRFVDDDVLVVTLFNYVSTFSREVEHGLAAIALGLPYEPVLLLDGVDVPDRVLKSLVGKYEIMGSTLEISVEDGRLWVTDSDMEKSATIPQNDTTYFVPASNALLSFQLSDRGTVERMIVQQSERRIPCPPLKKARPDRSAAGD
jgi:CubicO group peptidase (beta-lactamase class C family)